MKCQAAENLPSTERVLFWFGFFVVVLWVFFNVLGLQQWASNLKLPRKPPLLTISIWRFQQHPDWV